MHGIALSRQFGETVRTRIRFGRCSYPDVTPGTPVAAKALLASAHFQGVVTVPMSTAFKLSVTLLLELLYAFVTRSWMPFHFQGIELELLISTCRALMAGLVWLWFGDFIRSSIHSIRPHQRPGVIAVAGVLLVEALLCARLGLPGLPLQTTWAATSLIVGIHEELVFRGLLQTLLTRRLGWVPGVVLSNLCFTLFHFGAQPLNPVNFINLFLTGCVLGVVYCRTGSLLAVIAIHAAVDSIYSFSPFLHVPWPPLFTDFFDGLALLLALSLYPNRSMAAVSRMTQLVRVADDV